MRQNRFSRREPKINADEVKPDMDRHECEYTRFYQVTILDKGARILAFEKYCFFCGLVENPVPIGSEVQ